MSLLLDALKKAEKAKDEAKRRSQKISDADSEDPVLQVRTRNELPDISKPLEMHSEDIPGSGRDLSPDSDSPVPSAFSTSPARAPAQPREQAADEPPKRRQAAAAAAVAAENAPDPQAAQRAAAKNVFETKFREPNPKLPFYITMAVLGAFTLGTVVYFWYQLRPPPPLVNTGAKPPPDERKVEGGQAQPPGAPAAQAAQDASATIPGMPGQASTSAQAPAAPAAITPASAPKPATSPATTPVPVSKPAAAPAVKPAAPPRASSAPPQQRSPGQTGSTPADPSKVNVTRSAPMVNPKVEAGWNAYNQGNLGAAQSSYQDVLRDEPANRDALLGMAAIEMRLNRLERAESYYQKLVEADPRDPHANAGLIALRAQKSDPVQAESRLKNLLAAEPESSILHFALGNQYALQGRWPEAQQAYFKALAADPGNPDFAFNLAVSLDHVRQPKLALEYYRRAISLAQQRSSSFDQNLARNRAQELAQ